MQTGVTLNELAAMVTEAENAKRDLIVPSRSFSLVPTRSFKVDGETAPSAFPDDVGIKIYGDDKLHTVGPVAHENLSSKLAIPKGYYDRMKETAPGLLAQNVNAWLARSEDKRLVRTVFLFQFLHTGLCGLGAG